ncbi:MAG: Cys-Gln thioester bond-forming surface protein, partial [Oscillospiraceae bacterium]|nr:Cys-Gln thioester bond-forming surface protein [Oscillospiraceae bacterium]
MKKRILTFILALVLAVSLIPSAALASLAEGDTLENALSKLNISFRGDALDWLKIGGVTEELNYTYFNYNNGGSVEEHPVYCMTPSARGARELVRDGVAPGDGANTVEYIRGEKLSDAKVWAIYTNGYPHLQRESLGVQTDEEAYYATKIAIWMYLLGASPADVKINDGTTSPGGAVAAQRVYDAALAIYQRGMSEAGFGITNPSLTVTPTQATPQKKGGYYEQEITIESNKWVAGDAPGQLGYISLQWSGAIPAGTVIELSDGTDITAAMKFQAKSIGTTKWGGTIIVKYPAEIIDDLTAPPDGGGTGATWVAPELKVSATLTANNIYLAHCTAAGDNSGYAGQWYIVEGAPSEAVSANLLSSISGQNDNDSPGGDDPYDMGLRVVKLETGTLIPLAGAVFDVYDPDGVKLASLPTDANGEIRLPLTRVGYYTVTERIPSAYHVLPTHTSQGVQIAYNEVATVTFTNDPYGSLRVEKRDAANGDNLAGAVIQIKHIATGATFSAVTDASGVVEFLQIPTGGYEIQELTAPQGYALDSTVHTAAVRPLTEGAATYTLTNKANPGLRIIKLDRAASTPIEGVVFEVWHDGELYGEYTTNLAGEILLMNLPAGTYTAREKSTVAPYALDTTAQWIEITAGQGYISQLIFLNDAKPGVYLIKLDSENLSLPVPNAKFRIKQISGGSYDQEHQSDQNGEINLTFLDPGVYQIYEVSVPEPYLIDNAVRTVEILAGKPDARFVFTNTKKPTLEIIKYDPNLGVYLPGASFRIARIEDGAHYLDRVSGADGRVVIEGLNPGIYSVVETAAPSGYVLNPTEYHVQLFPGRTSTLVVNNEKKPNLLIVKTDAITGAPIPNTTFTVKKVDSSTVTTVKTDANGEALLTALDPGVYEI